MIYLDFAKNYQLLFQDPASPMMNGIIDLHHYVMFFLFVILTFVVVMLVSVIELFILKQSVKHVNYMIIHTGQDVSTMFPGVSKEDRLAVMDKYSSAVLARKDDFIERRQISLTAQTNLFWTELAAKKGYVTTYPFNLGESVNKSLYSHVFITDSITGDTVIENYKDLNLVSDMLISSNLSFFNSHWKNPSKYLSNIYLLGNDYNAGLPAVAVEGAVKQINEVALTSLAIVNIYQAYSLNLYYWMQIYFTVRSGIQNFTHSTVIEIVWTVIPSLVLVFIGIPSFILLYAMDEIIEPDLVVKCIGHQWYWSYEIEYPNFFFHKNTEIFDNTNDLTCDINDKNFVNNCLYRAALDITYNKEPYVDLGKTKLQNIHWGYMNFDSYMVPEADLKLGTPRLLEVDNALYLPVKTHIDLLVTANDVIHCWTVPSFGVKLDAVPGRINHANIFIERAGTFYGQCSEICGVNHGFMPIKVVAVPLREFLTNINK